MSPALTVAVSTVNVGVSVVVSPLIGLTVSGATPLVGVNVSTVVQLLLSAFTYQ